MELKIDVPIQEQECWAVDSMTGWMFKSKLSALMKMQQELNDKLIPKQHLSLMECYEIMTEDWPDEKREKFFDHLNKHEGWVCDRPVSEIQLFATHTDEGQLVVKVGESLLI